MILKKKIINIIIINLIFFLILNFNLRANEVKILLKINDQIITNIDVENEYKYLTSLNITLKDIKKNEVLLFAKKDLATSIRV